jgi:carboxymethylenebutenolidase
MRIAMAAMLLLAGTLALAAQGAKVTYASGKEQVSGMLYTPQGNGPFPALVVIHEWWGLNDWVKEQASKLADQGYVTLAVDLYRGKVATTPDEAHEIMRGVPQDRATQDLLAASAYLRSLKNVDPARVGSIGWCMGGGYSLQLALHDPRIKACAMCYGAVVTDADMLKPLHATVLGIFGEEDRGIPPEQVDKFEAALKNAGKNVEAIKEFKAGHGFMRPDNPGGTRNPIYREEAAKQAWQDIDKFFASTLQGK